MVTENRQTVGAFRRRHGGLHVCVSSLSGWMRLSPASMRRQPRTVQAWFVLFFQGEPVPADVEDVLTGGLQLGRQLKQHQLFCEFALLLGRGGRLQRCR